MFSTSAVCTGISRSPSGDVSFVYFQPEKGFHFIEGQFVVIEMLLNDKPYKRSYSIATTNVQLQQEGIIGCIVKKTAEGGMSEYLTHHIQIGETVILKGPVGHYIDKKQSKNYLLISVGSGLGPNYSLYKHLTEESQEYAHIVNIFGERFHANILAEVEDLFLTSEPPSTQHTIHHFLHLSQEETLPDGYLPGRIQQSIPKALHILGTDLTAYICGTPDMVNGVRELLISHTIEPHQIVVEKY